LLLFVPQSAMNRRHGARSGEHASVWAKVVVAAAIAAGLLLLLITLTGLETPESKARSFTRGDMIAQSFIAQSSPAVNRVIMPKGGADSSELECDPPAGPPVAPGPHPVRLGGGKVLNVYPHTMDEGSCCTIL
jgi:hypothetical protein